MSLFNTADYKHLLKEALLQKKSHVSSKYTFQGMAKAARIQKTYLSKVLNGDAHLSSDQVYLAAKYLGLRSDETHYLARVHEFQRSNLDERRAQLQKEIAKLQKLFLKTESVLTIDTEKRGDDEAKDYYLDPIHQIVHLFLTIPRFAHHPQKIAETLGITKEKLAQVLELLIRLKIVAIENGKYRVLKASLHLSKDSPIFKAYRTLVRLSAIERIQKLSEDETFNFSVVFSADEQTKGQIQQSFLKFIKELEQKVSKAPSDEVFQINFDLFSWTKN